MDSTDRSQAVAAAWEAFDVAAQVADTIAFEDGSDELQALIAAQASAEGRSLLPLPESGHPVDVPPLSPGAEGLTPLVSLLRRAQAALERMSGEPGVEEGGRAMMREAADKAATAAGALLAVRER
ncbi:hypothetical protein PV377_09845 [Streptomyces ipomoeae]|uniref:hypothetical protein n=1 Tax=Streptomyces ipomoeae TaxID=103232 RepID=UPI0029B31856|nr:hypothetical protein [Streptomyces ipomoeae]MDX2839280.1 hypothetical protein [Streptomyces ipomoeae]